MDEIDLYTQSFEYARDKGETDAYHLSGKLNRECITAIDKAIAASHYDQYYYNLPGAFDTVLKEFNLSRVIWVVAGAIRENESDRRYSQANIEWARDIAVPHESAQYFVFNSHQCVLDGFADNVRKAQIHDLAQRVGSYEKSHHMAERNRLTWFHPDMGSFVLNPGVTRQQLAERSDEITAKQSLLAEIRANRKAAKAACTPEKKHRETER